MACLYVTGIVRLILTRSTLPLLWFLLRVYYGLSLCECIGMLSRKFLPLPPSNSA